MNAPAEPSWTYPGKHADADQRDAGQWPRHRARERTRKRRRTSLIRTTNREDNR